MAGISKPHSESPGLIQERWAGFWNKLVSCMAVAFLRQRRAAAEHYDSFRWFCCGLTALTGCYRRVFKINTPHCPFGNKSTRFLYTCLKQPPLFGRDWKTLDLSKTASRGERM